MAQLVAGDCRRFPAARAQRTDLGWVVVLSGSGERVVPRGVHPVGGAAALELPTTVEDAFRSLERVSRIATDARAASALAAHARSHPVGRLLCQHGLPLWHTGADPCRMLVSQDGSATIGVGRVRTLMSGLAGLEDLVRHVVTARRPATTAQVRAALAWPILPAYLTKPVHAETDRDGELFGERCRQIVATSLQVLQDGSRLRRDVEWVAPDRLQPVVHAHSDLALYVHAFTERLLAVG